VVQCVGAYLAFKYRTDIKDKLEEGIKTKFNQFKTEPSVRKAVQEIQSQFGCCGSKGPEDYLNTGFVYPASCCDKSFSGNSSATCDKSDLKFTDGCVNVVETKLNSALGGLGGVAIGLVLIQLLIIVSACCLAREVR